MPLRPTDTSNFAEAVYAQLEPVTDLDPTNDWALLIFIAALGAMYKSVDDLAHSDPPWSLMMDVNNVPLEGLPWLGQLIGVVVNTNLPEQDQRDQIINHIGWGRGTLGAIAQAVKPFLTGTKTVTITERDTSAYHFHISTLAGETPPDITYANIYVDYATYEAFYLAMPTYEAYWIIDDREQIKLAITAAKPAGLQFVYSVT